MVRMGVLQIITLTHIQGPKGTEQRKNREVKRAEKQRPCSNKELNR